MKKILAIPAFLIFLLPLAVAQPQGYQRQMIGAGSPLYAADVAVDNFAMRLGLRLAGTVAQERASEIYDAAQNNNSEAVQKASREMNRVAERATSRDREGLEKAESIIKVVRERVNQRAQKGLNEAMSNIQKAKNRSPQGQDGPGSAQQGGKGGNQGGQGGPVSP